jgi:predicted membrane-bound spermidine synthase
MRLMALYLTSITCGFCMMALEILGGRLLQPAFGSSTDTWAAIISVFILSLSIGYVAGGRIADRARTNRALGWVVVAAGICYCLLPIYGLACTEGLHQAIQQARFGVLVSALALFLVPSLLLGMVSPMLVKLVFTSAERVGRTTGTLYAIGSFGNVVGILVANYLLLPFIDLNATLLGMGAVLIAVGVLHLAVRVQATLAQEAAPAGAAA